MIKRLILSLSVILTFQSYAVELDSLWLKWNDESISDSIRFEVLKEGIFGHYAYSDPDSALILADIMKERATKIQSKGG